MRMLKRQTINLGPGRSLYVHQEGTGTLDRVVEDNRQAKTLARQLPYGSLIEAEGAGHMLHHSHPELVIRLLRADVVSA